MECRTQPAAADIMEENMQDQEKQTSEASDGKKYIQSVERAMKLLTIIADHGSIRLNEISKEIGLKPTTTFGLLQTLLHTGFAAHGNSDTSYCLGLNSLKLGLCFNQASGLSAGIHTLLTELVREVDETAYFEVKIGSRYYYYDVVLSTRPLKVVPNDDHFIDLPEASAVAKVFRRDPAYPLYATDMEEIDEGLNCFAVPFYSGEDLIGCVALSGPSCRFTKEKMEQAYAVYCRLIRQLHLGERM